MQVDCSLAQKPYVRISSRASGTSSIVPALLAAFGSTSPVMHLSEGGTPGICGAFDFSEEVLVKIPTMGPKNLVKSDQISPDVPSI